MKLSKKVLACFVTLLMLLNTFTFTATVAYAENGEDEPSSNVYAKIYVAPDGDDETGDGSQEKPYKTIAKAKEVVRGMPKDRGDIIVEIADGFYPLEETLVFDARDSGSENCTIYYKAAPGAKPVISGGRMLEKGVWELAEGVPQAGGLPVYKTTLNRDEKLRAIYVNGKRANMTTSGVIGSNDRTTKGTPTVSFTMEDNPDWAWYNGNNIPAAIVFSANVGLSPNTKNPQNIEAERLGGARWARPFVCFASAEPAPEESGMPGGVMLRFQMPYAAISQSLSNNTNYSPNGNQVIRNAFEFLNKRGDFYFDQAEHTLYYIPLEGEDINTAEVIIPELECLIDIKGVPVGDRLDPDPANDAGRVRYITFDGLTFAHTDYKLHELTGTYTVSDLGKVTTSSRGYASVQGCIINTVYYPANVVNWHETFYRGYDIPPAAIRINAARNIKVLNGEIILTGFNGIHLENDVKDCEVRGNLIRDTLASAIVVGHPQHVYENDLPNIHESDDYDSLGRPIREWAGVDKEKFSYGTEAVPQDILIENNFMYRLCYGFPGANALMAFYTTNLQILHNFIYDCTYGAISLGWGWCEYDGYGFTSHGKNKNGGPYHGTHEDSLARSPAITTTSRNNKVNYNRIEEICTVVNDSGAIYTLGRQGDPGNLPGGGEWDTVNNLTNAPVTDPNHNWYHENWTNYTEMNYNFINPNPQDKPTDPNNWTNGFHPDEGSTFIKIVGNVVQSKLSHSPGQSRLFELNNWKRKSDMYVANNYVDGENLMNGAPRIVYENNYKSEERIWPLKGNEIVLNAGLTNEYAHLIPRDIIADTEFELASNVIMGKGETLKRRGLLKPEDTVWLAPPGTTEFEEGPTMTKAAGNEQTITAPTVAGEYKLYIVYGDGRETAVSKYTVYVDASASAVNVEDGQTYDVSAVRPLVLRLSDDYTYTLNGKPVQDGYEISTEGNWTLEIIGTNPTKVINFATKVSEANKLLTSDVYVGPGGTVRFAYDLNDPTKKIWISSASGGHFDGGDDETMTTGDKIGMKAPMMPGPYVLYVLDAEDNVLSQSHARIIVRDTTPPDIPREGLDLWLKADEGVKTDADGNVIAWENMGNIPATLVPADIFNSSGGDGLGRPTGNPKLERDVYDYVYFDANSRPLRAKDFKDYNGNTQMTIYALVAPEANGNSSSDQNGLVYFGLNEDDGEWPRNNDWSGISLGVGKNMINIRFGNAVAWNGGGESIQLASPINGLASVRAVLDVPNRHIYVNNQRVGGGNNSTALAGNQSYVSVGFTMSAKTPYRFLGKVAQILIYDRVLTEDEVAKIEAYFNEYKNGGGGLARPIEEVVDKNLLNALIDKVRGLDKTIYTAETWNALQSALTVAEAAASNDEIDQDEADDAYYGLREAFNALTIVPSGNSTAAYGTPVLGGEEIDPIWNTTVTLPIIKHLTMQNGPAEGYAKVLWDEENLYVLVRVYDPVLNNTSSNAHEQDSVEIFVDEKNSKATSYGEGMGQYRVSYENYQTFNPESIRTGFESYARIVEGGYIIEAKIPFKVVTPAPNHVIGFDLQINDARATGGRQDIVKWHDETDDSWRDGSNWGVLTLLGPDEDEEAKPFVITPVGGLVKEGGIKATVNVSLNPEAEEHTGTEVVVFQLMNGDTPVSIIALEKDIKETEQMTAFFNVDPEAGDYTVEVYVFDRFDNRSDIAPVILADGIIIN